MRMNFLGSLLGGGQQRQDYQELAQRYDQGAPWQGISDQEAYSRFQRVAPQQRMQLGQYLQQQAQQQNVAFPHQGGMEAFQDPGYLAQITGQMHQQQPGIL